MGIRPKQIGGSQESILMYEIAKKLDFLIKIRCCTTPEELQNLLLESGNDFLLEDNGNINLE